MPQAEREQAYSELKDSILQLDGMMQPNADTPAAGIEHGIEVPILSKSLWVLSPNESYVFETVNLTANGDTVINVQDYYTGAFIDGNDNCGTRLSGCAGYRSYLKIASSSTTRYVWVIVRSYWPGTAWDSATLRVTEGTNPAQDYPVSFTGGYHKRLTSFALNSHFLTTRESGNTVDDTVMLVTSNNAGYGIAFDDDSGTGWMSDIDTPQACSPNCYVIIGAYSHGTTTFIWDEDAHVASKNSDTDGLSDTLEALLGTWATFNDSDADGINDYEEIVGVDVSSNLLDFPWYGADPLKADLFVEADWKECVSANGAGCGIDPEHQSPDFYRLHASEADKIAARYFGPDVSIHIDTGEFNSDPNTRTVHNDWGGATRHSTPKGNDKCEWFSPERIGYFHAGRLDLGSGLGNIPPQLPCFDSDNSAYEFSHELGHTLGLRHGGKDDMNCKPDYLSIMNYAFPYYYSSGGSPFSRGTLLPLALNPTQMNEVAGLGTTDPSKLAVVSGPTMAFSFDPSVGALIGIVMA